MKKSYLKRQSYSTDKQLEEIAPLFVGMREYMPHDFFVGDNA